MHDTDNLQHAESAKCHQRNTLIGLLSPERDCLRHKERRVAQQAQPEENRHKFLHTVILAWRSQKAHDIPNHLQPATDLASALGPVTSAQNLASALLLSPRRHGKIELD